MYSISDKLKCSEGYLVSRIFEQAADDYIDLKRHGISEVNTANGRFYSLSELTDFYNSRWCNELLELMDINIVGSEIPNIINQSLMVV